MRFRRTLQRLLLLLPTLILPVLPTTASEKESLFEVNIDHPTPMWREGPVRYIITKEEDRAYKALKTEQERATFIDIFWRRRDPTPKTELNEFKDRFRNRALDANQLYAETAAPGWKSDMGKVYILVGPPDEMVRDRVPRSNRGTVMWIYRQPPFPDLAPNTVIAFAKNATGEYVLSTRPTWDSDVAHGIAMMGPNATDPENNLPMIGGKDPLLLSQGVPYSQGEFETRFIYARVQEMPPKEAAILHDVVTARSTFDVFPFESAYSYFKTSTENTLVALTLGIRTTSVQYRSSFGSKEVPDLALFGKLVDQDHPENQISVPPELFAPAPQNEKAGIDDYLIFQALFQVKPGRYLAVFAAEDKVASKVGTYREPLVVPAMTEKEKLTLSSITLAQSVAAEPPVEGEKPSPFRFGSLKVVQAAQAKFKASGSLNCYYQIYNVKKDDSGAANLDIDYEYFAIRDGKETSLGKIHVGPTPSQVQAYSLPLERFPKGDYMLRVEVVDRLAGIKTSGEASFTVLEVSK